MVHTLLLALDNTLLIVLSLCCIPKAATKGRVPYNALRPPMCVCGWEIVRWVCGGIRVREMRWVGGMGG